MPTRRLWLLTLLIIPTLACESSSPTEPGGLSGGSSSSGTQLNQGFETEVVSLMNQRRTQGATCGGTAFGSVGSVVMNGNLRQAARDHSIDMFERSYFSHVTPEGKTFDQRIRESGYARQPMSENIAAGQTSPQAVVNGWMASDGHCRNIMNGAARDVGIGFASNYWTANFGG